MGSSQSTPVYRSQRLVLPPTMYVGTVNKRFVKDRMTTLALENQFWTQPREHEFVIRDVHTDLPVLRVGPISEEDSTTQSRRRLLLDAYGVPVVGMERLDKPPRKADYIVIPGGAASKTDPFCTISSRIINSFEPPMRLLFTDPSTGKQNLISVRGHWQSRDAVITITTDAKRNGSLFCLARIYCDTDLRDGAFCMDVAPGVDLSLMVLVAAAMEEQTKKHESESDRKILKNAVKNAAVAKGAAVVAA